MELKTSMPITIGDIHGTIFGGRFTDYVPNTRRLVGIKMAAEVDHPHDAKVDTHDYGTPPVLEMQDGLRFGLEALAQGHDLYVGCMGGIGRTGLFMGCMAKVMMDYDDATGNHPAFLVGADPAMYDPVLYVRKTYLKTAIETKAQLAYVRQFDTAPLVEWLKGYHRRTVEVRVEYVDRVEYIDVPRDVEVTKYLGPIDWALHKLFG